MSVGDVNSKEKIAEADFIGITGFAQSGKDETVKILNEIEFQRVSLADPVRQGVYNIDPYVLVKPEDAHYDELDNVFVQSPYESANLVLRLREIVTLLGWDEAKKIPEVRRLLQYYGTEGGREVFGNTIWTDTADKYIRENKIEKVAVSDVRFMNELDWVRSKPNNLVIKIKRKGVGPVNSHSSDLGIADELCDIIINNDGSLEDLREKLINNAN